MKANIHPQWYPEAKVTCACGNTFTVGSTKPEIRVEICNKCHPFFTGQMKYVDTAGQVEKFQRKQEVSKTKADSWSKKKAKKKGQVPSEEKIKTLKEMLLGE
jgi:large subunit ribosomal protein L31